MAPSRLNKFMSNAVSFRGRQNALAWIVAGSLAYYFYVVPEQTRAKEQQVCAHHAHSPDSPPRRRWETLPLLSRVHWDIHLRHACGTN